MKYRTTASALAVFALAALALPASADASPWTNDRGEYFLQLGTSYYHASEYRDGSGQVRDDAEYSSFTTYLYGEVGVWDDVDVQFYAPLVAARAEHDMGEFEEFSGGDLSLSVQASPLELSFPTSIRLETKLPAYGVPDERGAPLPGDHQVDLALWLSAGGGLHHLEVPMYFYVDAGYVHRTQWNFDAQVPGRNFSDALSARVEAGYNVADLFNVSVGSQAFLPHSFDPDRDEAYVTVGPSLFWPVTDRVALDIDGYITPYSRNAGAGWALTAGVALFSPEK